MPTGDERVSFLVRMSAGQKEILQREATKNNMSMNDVVCHFIDWLDTLQPGEKFMATKIDVPTVAAPPPLEGQTAIPLEGDNPEGDTAA